jgi:hypothetical protein
MSLQNQTVNINNELSEQSSLRRHNRPWTINECLQLQREYELLQLSISEIAIRHERSFNAILYKLDSEGFV